MEELRNINELAHKLSERIEGYDGAEFVMPDKFKQDYKKILTRRIVYNQYNAIAITEGKHTQKIFFPNQWFYIASYFTDLYNELKKYRKYALLVEQDEKKIGEIKKKQFLNDEEERRLSSLDLSNASKELVKRFLTDYSWWSGGKGIERNDYYVSPILNFAGLVNASSSYVAELCTFFSDKEDLASTIIDYVESNYKLTNNNKQTGNSIQIIYYGTPGSGKSNKVKREYDENKKYGPDQIVRTTFHPDTDYASFIGGYKPIPEIVEENGEKVQKISYRFVPQSFTNAYVRAWNNPDKQYFLIIEEINRGNCAQIFGDTFQLLDRNDDGNSEYPIDADTDLREYLEHGKDEDGHEVLTNKDGIKNGKLCLPSNLNLIATMNTSDQSLFPMDTAFKRRWSWEYVPIDYDNEKSSKFTINIGGKPYNWSEFLKKINEKIKALTDSEDKQMGNFFIKHNVDENEFINKVMFYLWSEVGKDNYNTSSPLFVYKDKKNKDTKLEFSFNELFEEGRTYKLQSFIDIIIGNKESGANDSDTYNDNGEEDESDEGTENN